MPTKGASMRYGNTNGAHHRGEATENINYPWAKDFSRGGLDQHFIEHGKEFGVKTKQEYAAKAVHFANEVDRKNYKSVVDYKGTTYKYDSRNGRMVEVTKDGYVISYRHTGDRFWYYSRKGSKNMDKNLKQIKPMICPVCGKFYFSELLDVDIEQLGATPNTTQCRKCGWFYDLEQVADPNLKNEANEMSLNEYKDWYKNKIKENPKWENII